MTYSLQPFHLAIPVSDLEDARRFYVNVLGCSIGRFSESWIDYDFFGHQLTTHLKPEACVKVVANEVDGEQVPVRHFGIVLEWNDWHILRETLEDRKIEFLIKPTIRFEGQAGEQATMFITDPSNNALEFKSFKNRSNLFASE